MPDDARNVSNERTGPQLLRDPSFDGELTATLPATFNSYRVIRQDPTVALARAVRMALVIAGKWSVEVDEGIPDDVGDFVRKEFLPLREPLYEATLAGQTDFGYGPFEKVFAVRPLDGRIIISKFKPLLHDNTTILVDKGTGAFMGFRQEGALGGDKIVIDLPKALNIPARVEGTNWYGTSLLENARKTQHRYNVTEATAARYDRKVAGSILVISYPDGETEVDGVMKPNWQIADDLGKAAQSSGVMTIPHVIKEMMGEIETETVATWKIELLSDKGQAHAEFVRRMEYLDTQKVRAMLTAERMILEGKHGTKAETGEQADIVVTVLEWEDRSITRHVNWHALDQVLVLNWGEAMRGAVRLVAAPLQDETLAVIKAVYLAFMKNPSGFAEEFKHIDRFQMRERMGIPTQSTPDDELPIDEPELDPDDSARVTEVAGNPGED